MPMWANPDLASLSPEVAQRIISILTKCTKGIEKTGASPLGRASVRPVVQPDPAIVQQIVEMGFASARAEMALRRVRLPPHAVSCGSKCKANKALLLFRLLRRHPSLQLRRGKKGVL